MGRQKSVAKKRAQFSHAESHFKLDGIIPLTPNQEKTFKEYSEDNHLFLHGVAGTGKTYISCYLAMTELMQPRPAYKNLTLVRSVVPTRDIGFLPGNEDEKAEVYEAPYKSIFNELFRRGDAYTLLRKKSIVDFKTTSYIRGMTLNDTIVIVDECQNLSFHELDSVITRIGDNCKIIFCGDFRQSDFNKSNEKNGINIFMDIIKNLQDISFIEFDEEDIVRSEFVKSYIIQKLKMGLV
jgi:phosphate starvation-inducible protein PhoH